MNYQNLLSNLLKLKLTYVALSVFVLSALSFINPVKPGKLNISSKVKNQKGEKLEGVLVSISDSTGVLVDTMSTNKSGAYKFKLSYNQRFKVSYSLDGYKPIFMEFDTKIPRKKELLDYYYKPLEEIMIHDGLEFNDRAFANKPLTEVSFLENLDKFDYNPALIDEYLGQLVKPNVGVVILKGIVLNSADAPAKNVEVLAESIQGELIDKTNTNDNGHYELEVPFQQEATVTFKDNAHHETFVNVNTNIDSSRLKEEFTVDTDIKLYSKSDTSSNALAFQIPAEEIASSSDGFKKDERTAEAFKKLLETTIYKEVSVSGKLLTAQGIRSGIDVDLSGGMVTILAGMDTIRSLSISEDGSFSFRIPANENIRLVFFADSFRTSLVDVESQVNGDRIEKLNTDIVLFSLANDSLNVAAFEIPSQRHFFNNITGEFENDANVSEVFASVLNGEKEDVECAGRLPIRGLSRNMEGKKLPGVAISLYENGKLVLTETTDSKGRYRFDLKLKKNYRMVVQKEGYHEFFLNLNTEVPDDQTAVEFKDLVPPVTLIPLQFEDILNPLGFKQKPLAEIHYSNTEGEFTNRDGVFEDLFALVTKKPLGFVNEDSIKQVQDSLLAVQDSIDAIVPPNANNTFLSVKGRIANVDNKDLKDVKVKLTQPLAGELVFVKEVQTDKTGSYEMNLPYDRMFRLVFSDPDYYETFIELNTDVDGKYENRTIEIPDVKLYDREDASINPMAFATPWQQFAFDPVAATLQKNDSIPYLFTRMLNTPVASPLLSLTGRVKGTRSGYMKNVKVIAEKDTIINGEATTIVVDSVLTDRRGNYAMNLVYNVKYKLRFIDEDSHETFVSVDTRTGLQEEDLRREQHAAPTVLMYKKDDNRVDPFAFNSAFAAISFNPGSSKFFNKSSVNNNFMARVEIPKKESEEELNLDNVLVDVDEIESEEIEYEEKSLNELLGRYKDRADAAKLNANRQLTNDVQYNMAKSMVFNDTTDYSKVENVLLKNQSINNVLFDVFRPSDRDNERKQAEAAAKAAERSSFIAETVSKSLRKGIGSADDLVSLDSTFLVEAPTRISFDSTRINVKEIVSYDVRSGGKRLNYYTITNWFFFTDWYRNGVEIDEDKYVTELNNFKKLSERQ